MRVRTSVLVALLLLGGPLARAETRWISDVLTVPLRSGPSTGHRILHRGLPSGTALEVLETDKDSGFTRVRTPDGTEGWVNTQYLVAEPIARDRLAQAARRIESLERQLAERSQSVSALTSEGQAANADRDALTREVSRLEVELAELKRVSAAAVTADERNRQLAELNDRLQQEVDALIGELHTLQDDLNTRGMWIGGGLVLAGLLAGALLKSRPRRSGWS